MGNLLIIGMGGFVGAVSRYLLSGWVHQWLGGSSFPYGTLAVNVLGCLLIGFLGGLVESRQLLNPEARLFLFLGVLASFTTFSTFGFETIALLRDAQLFAAFGNVAAQLFLGLTAVWAGLVLSRYL